MAPLKKIYLEELARIQDRINSLFEQALLPSEYEDRDGGLPGTWAPSVDVLENILTAAIRAGEKTFK